MIDSGEGGQKAKADTGNMMEKVRWGVEEINKHRSFWTFQNPVIQQMKYCMVISVIHPPTHQNSYDEICWYFGEFWGTLRNEVKLLY